MTANPPKGRLLVNSKSMTLNQPYLWDIDVFNHLLIHVNEGPTLRITVEMGVRGDKVDVLDGTSNRSVGDDGRLRRHVDE